MRELLGFRFANGAEALGGEMAVPPSHVSARGARDVIGVDGGRLEKRCRACCRRRSDVTVTASTLVPCYLGAWPDVVALRSPALGQTVGTICQDAERATFGARARIAGTALHPRSAAIGGRNARREAYCGRGRDVPGVPCGSRMVAGWCSSRCGPMLIAGHCVVGADGAQRETQRSASIVRHLAR